MRKLRIYLRINSIFSSFTGIVMTHFSDELLEFFNIENKRYLFDVIGLNLIVFGLFVWHVSLKDLVQPVLAKIISLLDIGWVVGSLLIVAFQLFDLSKGGYILISLVAVWISFLAYKQLRGIKAITNE